jgi:FMN reductase
VQILTGFFATQVLAPPLYLAASAFSGGGGLHEAPAATARAHGRALVDLALACRASEHVASLRPLV